MATQGPDLDVDLKKNGLRPVYALDGEERVLVDEAVAKLRDLAVPPRSRDFNYDAFTGKQSQLTKVLDVAKTLPAFAQRRMVLVQGADAMFGEDGSDQLIAYIEAPNPTTTLVLVAEKLDARTKIYKALQKAGATFRFSSPHEREMPDRVRSRAKAMNVEIDDQAVRALCHAVGADLLAARQALEVLGLYAKDRTVTAADVESVVQVTKEESIFELTDAIGGRNKDKALMGLHQLIAVGRQHPLPILAMIARHFRNLVKAKAALDSGAGRDEIQRLVGIPPFAVDKILRQAKAQPLSVWTAGLEAIAETDKALKGGALEGHRAMERLVLALMA
jgi:DNA polymerase III subunit delta